MPISSFSFGVDMGKTQWLKNGQKQNDDYFSKDIQNEIPKNTLFNISSLVFNIEKSKEEVLSQYSCYYNQQEESFCVLIEETGKAAQFTKEIMINLIDLAQKLSVKAIYLLICRKNPEYVKLLQGMMTVGFEQESTIKTKEIEGKVYKILKMNIQSFPEEIEEIEF